MALADSLHLDQPKLAGRSPEGLVCGVESLLLNSHQVIPLLYLRASYGMNASVNNWSAAPNGSWRRSHWLGTGK